MDLFSFLVRKKKIHLQIIELLLWVCPELCPAAVVGRLLTTHQISVLLLPLCAVVSEKPLSNKKLHFPTPFTLGEILRPSSTEWKVAKEIFPKKKNLPRDSALSLFSCLQAEFETECDHGHQLFPKPDPYVLQGVNPQPQLRPDMSKT